MNFARYWQSTEVDVPDRFVRPARVRALERVGNLLRSAPHAVDRNLDGAGQSSKSNLWHQTTASAVVMVHE